MGVENVRCEIRTFSGELDEQETLIECNRQRKKTSSQIYNEVKLLEKIEKKRAEIRQKVSQLSGKTNSGEHRSAVPNLEQPRNTLQDFEKGRTLDVMAQKTGVPKMKLDTILEIGKLAETGKTKEIRESEKKAYHCNVSDRLYRYQY